jgi:hypothetical protein
MSASSSRCFGLAAPPSPFDHGPWRVSTRSFPGPLRASCFLSWPFSLPQGSTSLHRSDHLPADPGRSVPGHPPEVPAPFSAPSTESLLPGTRSNEFTALRTKTNPFELACHPKAAFRLLFPGSRHPTLPAQQPTNRSSLLKRLPSISGAERPKKLTRESPCGMTRGCSPRPRWSIHPLCTRSPVRPKPSRRAHVGGAPVHPKVSGRSRHPLRRHQARSEDHTRRIRAGQPSTIRDAPKSAAKANVTLKWTVRPPRRRNDLLAAANFPRSSRSRMLFRRHIANSSLRTRGQRPQAIELLRHVVRSEPKLEPSDVVERVAPPRRPVRTEARTFRCRGAGCSATSSGPNRSLNLQMSWSGLPAFQPLPERGGSGQDSRKTRFLVAGFHTRFVPPSPFFTTLAVCSSPSPPTCFSRSRSWSSCSRKAVPEEGRSGFQGPKALSSRESPHGPPLLTRSRITEAIRSPTCSWQARKRDSTCPYRGLIPSTGPAPWRRLLSHSTRPELQSRGSGGVIHGGPKSTTPHSIPPGNGCGLIRAETRTLPRSRAFRLVPRLPSAPPEGSVSVRSGSILRSRSPGRRLRAGVCRFDLSRPEDRS